MDSKWEPEQYLKFSNERFAPAMDLMEGLFSGPTGAALELLLKTKTTTNVVDLGSGSGELTQELHKGIMKKIQSSASVQTLGIELSPEMIGKAQLLSGSGLSFQQSSIEDWMESTPQESVDVIFSNAALHWVGGHSTGLVQGLMERLVPGGVLAVQMPRNFEHEAWKVIREVASAPPWNEQLDGFVYNYPVLSPDEYAVTLAGAGAEMSSVSVVDRVYLHPLASSRGVLEWVKGSSLSPYRAKLSPTAYNGFVDAVWNVMEDRLAASPAAKVSPGYLLTFKRVLMWAVRR